MSRGMKKFMPFASLIEQSDFIKAEFYKKGKRPKPIISPDDAERINEVLTSYVEGEEILITYFYDGYIKKLNTVIKRIDLVYKKLITPKLVIPLDDILNIEYV